MDVLLIGNGIDIQYGGTDYYNENIIKRAISNVDRDNFRVIDYPKDIVIHLRILFDFAKKFSLDISIIHNKAWTDEDRISLDNFMLRVSKSPLNNIWDIGFEDYFLIQRLYFNYTYNPNVGNTDTRENYYEYLRRFFLDSIYNQGKINDIIYPNKMMDFFKKYDIIFCLNYDRNIEKLGVHSVYYLHGAFHVLNEKYNNDSPMNKAMGIYTDTTNHEYLYSTALTTYCGKEKQDLLEQADKINSVLKYASDMKKEAEKTGTELFWKLKKIFDAYEKCPGYVYPQNYCYDKFEKICGKITILGMSPFNDDHIIRIINDTIDEINYYHYPGKNSKAEMKQMQELFKNKKISFLNVKDLWESFK